MRAVSLYIDEHHMISTALAVLSLTQPGRRDAALPMRKGTSVVIPATAARTTWNTSRATPYLLTSPAEGPDDERRPCSAGMHHQ